MKEPEKVIDFSEARRQRREHENRQELRRLGIHTRELVLMQRESMITDSIYWMQRAKRAEALMIRAEMLRTVAEIHEKASDLLREAAEAEIERLRGLL